MTTQTLKTILIMAGGTGGHVFPALTIAALLQSKGYRIHWLGTARGIEAQLVPAAGFAISYLKVSGLRRSSWVNLLLAPGRLVLSLCHGLWLMLRLRPMLVVGMGGFASGPGGLAAWLLRIPLLIHEQNAIAGTTNKLLAHLATVVLQAFPDTFKGKVQGITTGNPVRCDIACKDVAAFKNMQKGHKQALKVLVLGGSQGAATLNRIVPKVARCLQNKVQFWLQAGKKQIEETICYFNNAGLDTKLCNQAPTDNLTMQISPFIENMAAAYAWADIVLCRAGALTLAELVAAGLPSILVPYPQAVDDHQTKNAQALVDAGGAVLIAQSRLNATELSDKILQFYLDRQQLVSLALGARSLTTQNAAHDVVAQCLCLCESS